MKYLSLFLFSLLLISGDPKPSHDSFVMIQLFTSQGCSSCPPADRLVEKIKEEYKDKNVYVTSYHVDYWDRLGWKDPFSKKDFTKMQYRYADQFGERSVYTPQIVVNGKEHFVGSDESKLRRKISSYLDRTSSNKITVEKKQDDENIQLVFQISGETKQRRLEVAIVLKNKVTEVKRGENSNRTLSNSNIVLEQIPLYINKNGKVTISLPVKAYHQKGLSLIGFVQSENLEITGATQLDL